jgi:hypothetical protein
MAMLPLNNIFYNTWIGVLKKYGFEKPEKEFWEEAISEVKKTEKILFLLLKLIGILNGSYKILGLILLMIKN